MKAGDVVIIEMHYGGAAPEQWAIRRVIQKDGSFDLGEAILFDELSAAVSQARQLATDGGVDRFFAVQDGFDLSNLDAYPVCERCALRTHGIEINGLNGARIACPDCMLTISTHRQRN